MAKKYELIKNHVGGVDVILERDSGNPVRILTGRPISSLAFWRRMKKLADAAIEEIKSKK